MIDATAEFFKGELGTIYEISHNYSLKELEEYRRIRMKRKVKEAEEEKKRQEQLRRQREREEFRNKITSKHR